MSLSHWNAANKMLLREDETLQKRILKVLLNRSQLHHNIQNKQKSV